MNTRKTLSIISGFVLAVALMLAPRARADEANEASKLTFNQPLEIPGHRVLAAGTYWFVTMDGVSSADHNLVQIFNADRSERIMVLPTVAIQRPEASSTTEINFAESQGNRPKALVSWFYPHSMIGHEFVYGDQEEKVVASEPTLKVMAQPESPAYGD
jgi:hypothetical protein